MTTPQLNTTPERMKLYRSYGPEGVGGRILREMLDDIESLQEHVIYLTGQYTLKVSEVGEARDAVLEREKTK